MDIENKLVISSSLLLCNSEAKVVANLFPTEVVGVRIEEAVAYTERLKKCYNACEKISDQELDMIEAGLLRIYSDDEDE